MNRWPSLVKEKDIHLVLIYHYYDELESNEYPKHELLEQGLRWLNLLRVLVAKNVRIYMPIKYLFWKFMFFYICTS